MTKICNPKDIPFSLTPGVLFCSKIRTFNECQRKFYYTYVRNLESAGTSVPLFIGSMVHKAMDDWYSGMSNADVITWIDEHVRKEMFKRGVGKDADELTKHTALIKGMMLGYMEVFKSDLEEWNIIRTEQSFQVGDFVSTIDTLLTKKGEIVFNDFKTAASIDGEMLKNLGHDLQMQTYWRILEEALNIRVAKAYYTIIKKPQIRQKKTETVDDYCMRVRDLYVTQADDYFHREPIRRNKKHIDGVLNDVAWFIEAINAKFIDSYTGEAYDDDDILDPRNWPRNHKACRNFFRNCQFIDICRYGETTDKFLYFNERQGTDRGEILIKGTHDDQLKEMKDEIENHLDGPSST